MTRKHLWCVLALLPLMLARAWAQKAVMRDGHPAVECAPGSGGTPLWSIAQVDLNGKPAFRIPVEIFHHGLSARPGALLVTSDRVVYQPDPRHPQDSFDENRAAVTYSAGRFLTVETAQRKYSFDPSPSGYILAGYPECSSFVRLVFSDFAAAQKKFNELTKRLPPAREAAWRDFQPQAAAWRALPTKPVLSPEADRERILAENAIKEKNLDSATEHYEKALEVQPMWPAGWFNLAVIYAEQNRYAEANDSMKHYLELVPDAPDAKDARDQIIIWEDKAKR